MKLSYNVTDDSRKKLVGAISGQLNTAAKYLGMPSASYQIGDYTIDKTGTVIGPDNRDLVEDLSRLHGFRATTEEYDTSLTQADDIPEPEEMVVEVPLDGFTPEVLKNLRKMILAKEPLIKKALGVGYLPIHVLEDTVSFPWFKARTAAHAGAYIQFVHALCKTAKEKKRVTAKVSDAFENERFTMRVWLIGLGLIGPEYALIRKLMGQGLSGNSSWRNGKPAAVEPHSARDNGDAPAEGTPGGMESGRGLGAPVEPDALVI